MKKVMWAISFIALIGTTVVTVIYAHKVYAEEARKE